MQRADIPLRLWLYRHTARKLLGHGARLINRRAAAGVVTRLAKVKAHAGDPLNGAADALASAAAELDPSRPQEVDPEGVYFRYEGTLVPWNSRLQREPTQAAAAQWAAKCVRPVIGRGVAAARHVPLTTSRLLRPNQGRRRTLGKVMARMKTGSREKLAPQTLAGTHAGSALRLSTWGLTPSPACSLTRMLPLWARVGDPGTHSVCVPVAGSQGRENTSPPLETQAHIQCVCQCGSARLLRQREYESAMGLRRPCGAPSKGRPRGGPCTGKPQ